MGKLFNGLANIERSGVPNGMPYESIAKWHGDFRMELYELLEQVVLTFERGFTGRLLASFYFA